MLADRSSQTAAFDAVVTILILMVASTAIYTGVVSSIQGAGGARSGAELREASEAGAVAALSAAAPEVSYTDPGTGLCRTFLNVSGADLIRIIYQLERAGEGADVSVLAGALLELYELALFGRSFAVSLTGLEFDLLLTREDVSDRSEIPHPRTVVSNEISSGQDTIYIDLYTW